MSDQLFTPPEYSTAFLPLKDSKLFSLSSKFSLLYLNQHFGAVRHFSALLFEGLRNGP